MDYGRDVVTQELEVAALMNSSKIPYGTKRLLALQVIKVVLNIIGAAVTYVWFSQIQPGLSGSGDLAVIRDRAIFIIILIITILVIGLPYEFRWFGPLVREFKKLGIQLNGQNIGLAERKTLSDLAGKLLNIPIRMSATNAGAWLISAVIFAVIPHAFPEYCPWDASSAIKISAWTVFLGGPFTVAFSYFVVECWVRKTVQEVFPVEALLRRPTSVYISALSRLLVVSLMIGTVPPIVIGHVTLHQISEIQQGYHSIDQFLAQMPVAIVFLVTLSVSVAVCLSIFLARSIFEPLRQTGLGMNRVGKGNLDTSVPVVSNDEIGIVADGFNSMVDGLREREYIRETFGSYISEAVVTEILESPEGVKLGGELREIAILVSDLRGFTRMTDSLQPQRVIQILNRYFEKMTDVIVRHEGTIDEFTGDGILVFFGAPKPSPDHKIVAVACALAMQEALQELNAENALNGWPELRMGIGINSGQLVVGNIGSEKRKKYGAVGTPINVAFRVESLASSGEVLVTPPVYEQALEYLELGSMRQAKIKGFDNPITLCSVISMKQKYAEHALI
ncbi:MAG: adenylate/guanylate cyclase domain-containing protein [Desulfomonilaceae bacterium]